MSPAMVSLFLLYDRLIIPEWLWVIEETYGCTQGGDCLMLGDQNHDHYIDSNVLYLVRIKR